MVPHEEKFGKIPTAFVFSRISQVKSSLERITDSLDERNQYSNWRGKG